MKLICHHDCHHEAIFLAFRKPLSDMELTELCHHQNHENHENRKSFSHKAELVVVLMNKALHFANLCQIIAYESSRNLLDLRSRCVT
jgi:hypothetical protein